MSRRGRGLLRLAGLIGAAVVVAVGLILATGSGEAGPGGAGSAAGVVPSDALAYVHAWLGSADGEVRAAQRLAAGMRGWRALVRRVDGQLGALTGAGDRFAAESRPWLGDQAALALIPKGGTQATLLIALGVRQPSAARRFLARSASSSGSLAGFTIYRYPAGFEAVVAPGYMMLGERAAIHTAVGVAAGRVTSLASVPAYRHEAALQPRRQVLSAYLPAIGVASILSGRSGPLGALGELLGRPGVRAVSATLAPAAHGFTAWIGTATHRGVTGKSPPVLSASELPGNLALAVMLGDLRQAAPQLIAAAGWLGAGHQLAGLLVRAATALQSQGVSLTGVLSLFARGAAVGVGDDGGLLVVGRTADPARARLTLARVAGPLAALFPNSAGQVPLLSTTSYHGVPVSSLQLGPGLALDYAVFRGLVAISTSGAVLRSMIAGGRPLSASAGYQEVVGDDDSAASALVFANFSRLVAIAADAGLLKGAGFGPLTPDLAQIRAIGIRESRHDTDTTAELQVRTR